MSSTTTVFPEHFTSVESAYIASKIAELETTKSTIFEFRGTLTTIEESGCEDGYTMDVYVFTDFINGEELDSVDGGLCTGSAEDAVMFFIPN